MLKHKTLGTLFVVAAVLALSSTAVQATYCKNGATNYPKCDNNTPPPPPAPPTSTSNKQGQKQGQGQSQTSTSGATSGSSSGAAAGASAGSDVKVDSSDNSMYNTRSWSLGLPPIAYTPPMQVVPGCTYAQQGQSATGVLFGVFSHADSKYDTSDCFLIDRRNSLVQQCQYASARDIDNLLIAKYLSKYRYKLTVNEDGSVSKDAPVFNLSASDCDAEKRLVALQSQPQPQQPVVNYYTTYTTVHETNACSVPTKAKPKKKVVAAKPTSPCTK